MPTCLEHWAAMPPTTCYGYKRRYLDVESIKKQIIIHGKSAGVIISDDNDGPGLLLDDFIKASPKQVSRKRPRIQAQPVAVVIQLPDVNDSTEQPMAQSQVPMQEANQFMDQVQPLVHTAEQPIADAAPVLMVQAQAQQPMDNATPVPMVQAQAQQPMADAAPVPTVISLPHCTNIPIFNGVRKPLVLNGLVIEVDPDTFMVNATMMCKAAGKEYFDYAKTAKAKSFLQAIESKPIFVGLDLIKSNRGGDHSGTMVHRLIAYDLASWLSGDIKLQFYMWIAELCIENAALSTQIKELQANAADSACANAIAPTSAHLRNVNGVRKPLVLNGLVIEVDPDTFMVNATQMCKAAGKFFAEYHRSKCYKDFENELSKAMGIPIGELTRCENGNRKGSMVHRRIALHLAHRISPEFEVQVTGYLDELFMTGRVELGNEMNVQQLEDVWKRLVDEVKAKASADVKAEQDRCQELEMQLATIQEEHQLTKAAQEKLVAIKTREDLEAAIQFQVNTTAPTIVTYKEGDNVLYLARIDETKFKYGHTKNLKQRLEPHTRPGAYPTFELVWIVKSNNGVASEDQLHAYVKKKKIIAEYGTQREVILLKSVDDLERMLKKMNKCALPRANADIGMRRLDIKIRKIEANAEVKINKIKAGAEVEKTKQMEINPKIMLLQMLAKKTITFEQYMQIKNT